MRCNGVGCSSRVAPVSSPRGFTLLELLVVIIIILLLMLMVMMLFNQISRGQEVRAAGRLVEQSLADARQRAAQLRRVHFVRLYNDAASERGMIEIYEDTDRDRNLNVTVDKMLSAGKTPLPKWCEFTTGKFPDWMAVDPTSYVRFNGGYSGVQRNTFDSNFNGQTPTVQGDVVIEVRNKPHMICLDIDRTAGKVRRQEYLFKSN